MATRIYMYIGVFYKHCYSIAYFGNKNDYKSCQCGKYISTLLKIQSVKVQDLRIIYEKMASTDGFLSQISG